MIPRNISRDNIQNVTKSNNCNNTNNNHRTYKKYVRICKPVGCSCCDICYIKKHFGSDNICHDVDIKRIKKCCNCSESEQISNQTSQSESECEQTDCEQSESAQPTNDTDCSSTSNSSDDSCNTKIYDIIKTYDEKMNTTVDYIQNQLNDIKKLFILEYEKNELDIERYKQLYLEIDKINNVMEDCLLKKCGDSKIECQSCNVIFNETDAIHIYEISECIKWIYITVVGGGGAGGCGSIVNSIYYSGGGGGSGAAIVKKPIFTGGKKTVLQITVGKGGSMMSGSCDGTATIVKVIIEGQPTITITVEGGKSGNPICGDDNTTQIVDGGTGGKTDTCVQLGGCDGSPGSITIPSQPVANGGNGASSILASGGTGGGNIFASGGKGFIMTYTGEFFVGENGTFGSGGGGAVPRLNLANLPIQLSGNGGDGVCIIEW